MTENNFFLSNIAPNGRNVYASRFLILTIESQTTLASRDLVVFIVWSSRRLHARLIMCRTSCIKHWFTRSRTRFIHRNYSWSLSAQRAQRTTRSRWDGIVRKERIGIGMNEYLRGISFSEVDDIAAECVRLIIYALYLVLAPFESLLSLFHQTRVLSRSSEI